MNIFKQYFTIIFIILAAGLYGQEVLTGVQFNETIREQNSTGTEAERLRDVRDQIQLPFFDDFKNDYARPNPEHWKDIDVFINKDFPYFAPNAGAATFDALDSTGNVYSNAVWIPFEADKLTSNPIRLDSVFEPVTKALSPADSLYLSFYYQPQGYGDAPESWDTLLLELSYLTGDTVFSHIDSVLVSANLYLEDENDTIRPFDTIYAPPGCNEDLYIINFQTLTWDDWLMMPCDSVFVAEIGWKTAWKSEGMTLDEFREQNGKDFVQMMIPIKDSIFFHDKFMFRFRNYASIANNNIPSWRSNADQWNVDYVYLNYNRSVADSTYRVLTFSDRAPSFLKTYQVMPYRQYRADAPYNVMKENLEMYISNLDKVEHNTKYMYRVQQVNGSFGYQYNGGSCNLMPFYVSGFQSCSTSCGSAHACPPVNSPFNFDYSRDTTSYIIKHYISDSSESNIIVDSVSYRQGFYNYYAYDDGTPELGYGLEPAGALLAYQFKLSVPDTLFGVQMYFNRVKDDANSQFFNINIWQDNNGKPGDIVAQIPSQQAMWEDGLYKFYAYLLEEPVILSGTFYVGWQQFEGGSLNIGFDANNDNRSKIFYKVDETWYTSNFGGSLLIRPMFAPEMILSSGDISSEEKEKVSIFPNPARTHFTIGNESIKQDHKATLLIYNMYGAVIKKINNLSGQIDISQLATGMYIVKISSKGDVFNEKLLISR
ncbi:MAG: hypothetical protein DRI88_01390 [Bacteroidetes bacterium]|nr:MAG: hypothetical protein DRI88_01390 [Bacteroidota bacterium]